MGISRQTAGKRLRRSRSGEGLSNRSSPPDVEERVCEARSSMLLAPLGLAAATGVPARARARGSSPGGHAEARRRRPRDWEAAPPRPGRPVRYERERPGELPRVDVKKAARMPGGGGHRALGRGCGSARARARPGLRVAVDDFGRVALRRAAARRAQGRLRGVHGPVPALLRGHGRAGRA